MIDDECSEFMSSWFEITFSGALAVVVFDAIAAVASCKTEFRLVGRAWVPVGGVAA